MAPSSGQLYEDEEREPTSTPAIPEEGVYEVEYSEKRVNVVRLLPNGFSGKEAEEISRPLCKTLQRSKLRKETTILSRRESRL
ncbi:hypothetical protein [Acidianus infernus]|uniref:hypothetical protein n=1 Tax=Acidianus infernus TaxID=12915 RepID=UPI001F0FEC3E|nr:hypothetical protein [Acidianus infernus]